MPKPSPSTRRRWKILTLLMLTTDWVRPTCILVKKTRLSPNSRCISSCVHNTWPISTSKEPRFGSSFTQRKLRCLRSSDWCTDFCTSNHESFIAESTRQVEQNSEEHL